ncbi:hypothetical protein SME22J_40380 [Serratia marcescens]|nr:hypothetical protein SME22J_40380 [Serratia marcescens]BEO44631.1 hypothetical protein SMQE13_39820 [Serratia marcescens]
MRGIRVKLQNSHFIWSWRSLAVLALALAKSAWADCDYSDKSDIKNALNITAPIVSGNITVGSEVARGATLYTQNFNPTFRNVYVECSTAQQFVAIDMGYEPPPHPLSEWSGGFGKVYQTGVPGVGVFIDNHTLPFTLPYSSQSTDSNTLYGWSSNLFKYRIRLIKTGDIQPGTITGADLPCLVTRVGPVVSPFTAMRLCFTGSINIVAQTCTTPDVFVAMGNYETGAYFKGQGSVTEWKDASIRLLNCPRFYGTTSTYYSDSGAGGITSSTPNRIEVSLTPNTDIIDSDQGILSLKKGSGSADGIGIQLAYNFGGVRQWVNFARTMTREMPNSDATSYTIPLQARYIQTEPTVTPGAADATVTFNINYY